MILYGIKDGPENKHEESDNDVQPQDDKSTRDKMGQQLTEFVYTKHQMEILSIYYYSSICKKQKRVS